ncbi:uncharacterized protein TNCV_4163651 [Trichonephila clavipes]|nr:uncharacterized protein TNCV_4163651 [Trichonephila clavipes]
MDEQLKALLEGINALKSGQDMQKSQGENGEYAEETKQEMQKFELGMEKGLENVQKCQEDLKNSLEKKIDYVEEKINSVEEKIALKVEEKIAVVEEKIAVVEEKITVVEEKITVVEEKIVVVEEKIAVVEEKTKKVGGKIEKIKEQVEERIEVAGNFSQRVEDLEKKLLACGKTTNENKFVPASAVPVPVSDQGEAAEVLQTLPDTERLNLNSLCNALDLRFGHKYSKDYARLQMKTRLQKAGESLQEYASEEAATQASRRDRQSIRGARVTAVKPCEYRLLKEMEKLKEEMQTIKAGISNQEKRNFECWGYGGIGHLGRNCPRSRKDENTVSSSKQEN